MELPGGYLQFISSSVLINAGGLMLSCSATRGGILPTLTGTAQHRISNGETRACNERKVLCPLYSAALPVHGSEITQGLPLPWLFLHPQLLQLQDSARGL